jgi:hypothetical protein
MTNTSVEKAHISVDKASAAFHAPSCTRFEVTSWSRAPADLTDVLVLALTNMHAALRWISDIPRGGTKSRHVLPSMPPHAAYLPLS